MQPLSKLGSTVDLGLIEVVKPGDIGVGEIVSVYTKMGRFMARGVVTSVLPRLGVQISSTNPGVHYTEYELGAFSKNTFTKDTSIIDRFDKIYDPDLYAFVIEPKVEEGDVKPDNVLEAEPVTKEVISNEPPAKKVDQTPKKAKSSSSTMNIQGADVNVDSLPKELQNKVLSFKEMDEDQVNAIMSSISEAALSSMKRVGIKDTLIYPKIVDIQSAVQEVLNVQNSKSK